ncbi:hypothetical protein Q3G72_006364 [Acer saccharum]|nr:hypothetical protein Q3G72_006364 [Acer saccharum]
MILINLNYNSESAREFDSGACFLLFPVCSQFDNVGVLDIDYDADVPTNKLRLGRNGCQRRWLVSSTEDGFDRSGWTEDLGLIGMGGQRIWEFRINRVNSGQKGRKVLNCSKHGRYGIVARRVIPSDNSCLFNAVGYVMDHDKNKAPELRQVIAATGKQSDKIFRRISWKAK